MRTVRLLIFSVSCFILLLNTAAQEVAKENIESILEDLESYDTNLKLEFNESSNNPKNYYRFNTPVGSIIGVRFNITIYNNNEIIYDSIFRPYLPENALFQHGNTVKWIYAKIDYIDLCLKLIREVKEEYYKDIIIHRQSRYLKIAIAKTTNNQDILKLLINKELDFKIREAAVKRITDQETLIDFAKNDDHDRVRIAAIAGITNQNILIGFAKNDDDFRIREAAVKRITDQKSLLDFARNDYDYRVRLAAVERITNQKTLFDYAKNDSVDAVRAAAVTGITDQNILIDFAKNDDHNRVRIAAIAGITNQNILIGFAKNDDDFRIRIAAVEKLIDPYILSDIYYNERHSGTKEVIRKRCLEQIDRITDQKVLSDIVIRDIYGSNKAIDKITNQELLASIILEENVDYYYAKKAINKITNQELLASIVLEESVNYRCAEEAIKRINNKDLLEYIKKNSNFKQLAKGRLKELKQEDSR